MDDSTKLTQADALLSLIASLWIEIQKRDAIIAQLSKSSEKEDD